MLTLILCGGALAILILAQKSAKGCDALQWALSMQLMTEILAYLQDI